VTDVYVNQMYTATVTFVGPDNVTLTDPTTVTFTKQASDGTQTTVLQAALTHVGVGIWSYTTSEAVPGTYTWEGKGVGAVIARDLIRVRVKPGIT